MRHHYWEWFIPAYLFLGGLGGGIMFLSMLFSLFFFPGSEAVAAALWLPVFASLACICLGCLFLVLDLGQPFVFYRAFVKNKSVIAWGARFLTVTMICAAIWWLSYIPLDFFAGLDAFLAPARVPCLFLSGICGFAVMVYTGTMLSTLKAHSFWATPAFPTLWTISATSTGCAGIMLFAGIHPAMGDAAVKLATEEIKHLAHTGDIILVFLEMLVLLLMILSFLGAGNKVQNACAHRWIHGRLAVWFWVGMIGIGLVIPQIINICFGDVHVLAYIVGPIMVLCGGCLLRFLCIDTDDREEVPGETRYFSRLTKKNEARAAFTHRWTTNKQNPFYWYTDNEY